MYLQTLTLRQFRSYADIPLAVDRGVNLFLGLNGSGKTNLLEAIAVLTTGVSPRGGDTESMVQWNKDGFLIQGEFKDDQGGSFSLEMKYRVGSSRMIRENGEKVIRLRDLIGRIPLVSFVPEDLSLIKGEPSLRRRAMDMILAQVDGVYAAHMKRYGDAIRARNAVLRRAADGPFEAETLEAWDKAVVDAGLVICRRRAAFIEEFNTRAAVVHRRLSGDREALSLSYKPSFEGPWDSDGAERWMQKFKSIRRQEIAVGATMVGPHRDDIHFLLDGRSAKQFGSEGQKRTGAVSFKLAEIPYIEEKTGQKPICLLDDVLSELDLKRADHLLDELSKTGQCFVTMTGLESWPAGKPLPAAVYRVDNAVVTPEQVLAESKEPF